MEEQREVGELHFSSFRPDSEGIGDAADDGDGFQCDAMEHLLRLRKGNAASEQGAEPAGASAEDGHEEVSGAGKSPGERAVAAEQLDDPAHLDAALGEESGLRIVDRIAVRGARGAERLGGFGIEVADFPVGDSDGEGDAHGVGVFECGASFDSGDVGGSLNVIIAGGEQFARPGDGGRVGAAEHDHGVAAVGQFEADARSADCAEGDSAAPFRRQLRRQVVRERSEPAVCVSVQSFGDGEDRNARPQFGKHLLREPLHAETADSTDHEIGAVECPGELFALERFDVFRHPPAQGRVDAVGTDRFDDGAVERRSDQADPVSVIGCGACHRRTHHSGAYDGDDAHENSFLFLKAVKNPVGGVAGDGVDVGGQHPVEFGVVVGAPGVDLDAEAVEPVGQFGREFVPVDADSADRAEQFPVFGKVDGFGVQKPVQEQMRIQFPGVEQHLRMETDDRTVVDPVPAFEFPDHFARAFAVVLLEFDAEVESRTFRFDQVQKLFESGNPGSREPRVQPGAEVEPPQLFERVFRDRSSAVAAPFEGVVVGDDQRPVPGRMDVEFDGVHRQFQRLLKSGNGIFRIICGNAPVGDQPWHLHIDLPPDGCVRFSGLNIKSC